MLKTRIEAIIYAAQEPVALAHIVSLLKDDIALEAAEPPDDAQVKTRVREALEALIADYAAPDRAMEIRQIAGGYRMATKPEHHDVVRAFAKSLKPPVRLSLPALETLAVVAYKQPITVPEISEIRGVDSSGVIATLLDRKLITTAGRKQVIGRPILYKTTREFLMRFGLSDVGELPSMEEFEKLAGEAVGELGGVADATGVPEVSEGDLSETEAAEPDASGDSEPAAELDADSQEPTPEHDHSEV